MATIYGSVTDADAYFTERGGVAAFPAWFGADESGKQVAMVHGSDYIDLRYEQLMQGGRTSETQPRAYPRSGVTVHGYLISSSVVPEIAKQASWEAALRHLQGVTLIPDSIDRTEGGEIIAEEKQAGTVRKSVTYQPRTQTNIRTFGRIDALMGPLLTGGTGGVPVRFQL